VSNSESRQFFKSLHNPFDSDNRGCLFKQR
jgi:hypothetical protein